MARKLKRQKGRYRHPYPPQPFGLLWSCGKMQTGGRLVEPSRLEPGTFLLRSLVKHSAPRELVVDLGFYVYKELLERQDSFQSGRRVRWNEETERFVRAPKDAEPYYYEGEVEKVVDGDTLLVYVAIGFGIVCLKRLTVCTL